MFTFVLVCAVGFVYGEKSGAIFGLVGGILIDALGFSGVMISTILYTVLGYLCGRIVGWFLSKNLPSFAVYALIAGIIKGIFTWFKCQNYLKTYDQAFLTTTLIPCILVLPTSHRCHFNSLPKFFFSK